jgi:TolB-like protein/Tfp pilus assembly protein PilF
MFTDMVGYTSLAQENEPLAMELLEEHRSTLRSSFQKHNGKEVKTIGDAFLAEFASALEAVRCAFDIQQSLHERNTVSASKKQIRLRIGIHLGDVIHTQNDVYGDAVNVASRIEPLADPGGICLTEQVYDHVKNKFDFPMLPIGQHGLKNVDDPPDVYKVLLPWEGKANSSNRFDTRRIAVLPFANISPDSGDEYFADGMTEELISAISKIPELTVISRTSVMKYKGGHKGIEEIRPELKVGTVLEGSVRKAGTKVRISVQLIDENTEGHLWAENYNRELQDVFDVQSDIAHKVADSLKIRLLAKDTRRVEKAPTANMEAYTLYLKGRYFWNERTLDGLNKAIRYFEAAIKGDPQYALAYAGLADCYIILENWNFLRPEEALPKAMEYSKKALEIDDMLAEAHTSMAALLWDWDRAESEFRRAIELNPNYATAHHWYGHGFLELHKRYDEAITEISKAQQLDPLSSIIATNLGDALFFAGRVGEAIDQYRQVLQTDPNFAYAHTRLGIALIATSAFEEAIAEVEKSWGLSQENIETKTTLAYAYFAAGKAEDAEKTLEEIAEIAKTRYVSPALFAEVYSVFGMLDEAFEWFDKALKSKSSTLLMNLREPQFDPVRSDPRYRRLIQRIGLE